MPKNPREVIPEPTKRVSEANRGRGQPERIPQAEARDLLGREPTESVEQQRLFQWARMAAGARPELGLLYHIPNEGKRSVKTGARMKAEGLKKGVPDVCLPVARGGCHGLYIELKRERSGRATQEQVAWMDALMAEGYAVSLCHGWERAAEAIEAYLEGGEPNE